MLNPPRGKGTFALLSQSKLRIGLPNILGYYELAQDPNKVKYFKAPRISQGRLRTYLNLQKVTFSLKLVERNSATLCLKTVGTI